MRVLVDTCVWSLALRRRPSSLTGKERVCREALEELLRDDRVALIGLVRQELLSGVRDLAQFERLRLALRSFPDERLTIEDHEEAARVSNRCRAGGVSGSAVDVLMCAVSLRRRFHIFTTDRDFDRYARVVPIALFRPPGT